MILEPQQQIQNQGQSLYEIDELLHQTESHSCCSGFRRFLNYKYQDRQFYYAAKDEWSQVLIKTPMIPDQVSSDELKKIHQKFEYECKEVLSSHPGWFPQIFDYFEISENESGQSEDSQSTPVLVQEYPYSDKLSDLIKEDRLSPVDRVKLSVLLLDFFETLQNNNQFCFGVSLDKLLVGPHLRLQCAFSERVLNTNEPVEVSPQKELLILAPELKEAPLNVTKATDVYHWASLSALIIGGEKTENELNGQKDHIVLSKSLLKEIQQEFLNSTESNELILRPLSPEHYQKKAKQMVKGLGTLLSSCLQSNPKKRSQSIQELRKKSSRSSSGGIRKMMNPFLK
jgi:hypothetical protein